MKRGRAGGREGGPTVGGIDQDGEEGDPFPAQGLDGHRHLVIRARSIIYFIKSPILNRL
jgi:hypothetical protein